MPSDSQVGQTTDPSGLGPARANLSARQAKAAGLLTSGTYGPHCSTLLNSAVLIDFLASRLRAQPDLRGTTLYRTTWKLRVTPQVRPIFALRASAPRTSDSVCTGWPTPRSSDQHCETEAAAAKEMNRDHAGGGAKLAVATHLAGWPTPQTSDHRPGHESRADDTARGNLNDRSVLAGWATPSARDWHSASGSQDLMDERAAQSRGKPLSEQTWTLLPGPARLTASGKILTGSSAGMESGGQLAPAHSLWLMGFPPEWENCAPPATRSSRKSLPPLSER